MFYAVYSRHVLINTKSTIGLPLNQSGSKTLGMWEKKPQNMKDVKHGGDGEILV